MSVTYKGNDDELLVAVILDKVLLVRLAATGIPSSEVGVAVTWTLLAIKYQCGCKDFCEPE